MPDLEKVIYSIERCICHVPDACRDCAYDAGHPYNECVELLLKDALELLKAQEAKWISVKDDMPKEHDSISANHTHLSKYMWTKESDNVIVYVRFPDGTGRSTEGRLHDGKWWTRISPLLEPVVTHWTPLPEPPKEET